MCCPSQSNIAWGDFVTWLIIILGWIIAIRSQQKNETRKEVYSTLQVIYSALLSIKDDAIKFHTQSNFDEHLLFNILSNQQRVYVDIKRLVDILEYDLKVLDMKNFELRKAISLNNADASTFRSLSSSEDVLKSICEAHDDLADFLQYSYYSRYF